MMRHQAVIGLLSPRAEPDRSNHLHLTFLTRFPRVADGSIGSRQLQLLKNLARYIIRASFSQQRMQYLDQEGKVIYTAKDKKTSKVFPALTLT